MAHPFDNNGFRHFLKFYDFDMDWYEICEPIGFNTAKYVKKQLPNRWTRDVEYFAIDGVKFVDVFGQRLAEPRVYNPQGDVSEYMDYGLWWLLENRRIKGSEMKVGYKIQRNGVDFREFELDNRGDDLTDGSTYYNCKLVEVGLVADHFRNLKNTFNAFGDKNFKGEPITPIESFNYLVKATPLNRETIFKTSSSYFFDLGTIFFPDWYVNPAQQITKSEINNTLGWINPAAQVPSDFGLIEVVTSLTNVQITIDVDIDYRLISNDSYMELRIGTPSNGYSTLFYRNDAAGTITQTFTVNYNVIENGERLYCSVHSYLVTRILFKKFEISVAAVEQDIDIVCPAVKYIDLIKQGVKWVNALPVGAPRFDVGGEFYKQAVFSRALLGQRKELYTTNEDLQQSLQEYCADVEISTQKVDIRQHQDFYQNVEIGSFLVIPSDEYTEPYDEYYLINNYGFGYKNFEQDRTSKDTVQSFHTFSEWLPKNERADKTKKIENEFIRDPFLKQATFNLEIKTPQTSTEKDEKLFIEDMIELPPNSSREFVRTLLMRWQDGKLEILNRNTLGTNTDAILNWNTIGIAVGATVQILSGVNVGNYTVFNIKADGTVLTLTPTSGVSQFTGNGTIRIRHNFVNVFWQTRTNEGFTIAPKGYSNLAYTIKRNIKYWYYYLSTATIYCKKDIINSFFKNFGKLETQLDTETTPVIEDAPILYADLPAPLVEPITIKAKIVADYDDVVGYLEKYRTTKGFIRIFDQNGKVKRVYPKLFEYTPATNEAEIQGEKKYEDEFLRIDIVAGQALVNDSPYNLQGVAEWFKTKNDYIQLYDKKSQPLSNFYKYDFVILNGQKFNSIAELVNQLNQIQWT